MALESELTRIRVDFRSFKSRIFFKVLNREKLDLRNAKWNQSWCTYWTAPEKFDFKVKNCEHFDVIKNKKFVNNAENDLFHLIFRQELNFDLRFGSLYQHEVTRWSHNYHKFSITAWKILFYLGLAQKDDASLKFFSVEELWLHYLILTY